MLPPFQYFGGKASMADTIIGQFPPHLHYVEPFGGSLAVLLAKGRSALETVNDLDEHLVTFWRVLRDRPDDLARVCDLTPHSRRETVAARDLDIDDDLERARRVWVQLTQARGGSLRATGWRHNVSNVGGGGGVAASLPTFVQRILPCAERLRGVTLECRDAIEMIEDYGTDPETLIYADPPYAAGTRAATKRYRIEMQDADLHRAMAKALHAARAAVIVSGYASPLYDDLFADWFTHSFRANAGNAREGATARTEVLWSNRPIGEDLFTYHEMEP